jgi:hypothetical protein
MFQTLLRRARIATLIVAAAAVIAVTWPLAAKSGSFEVVVTALDNPRGLNFGPLGRLYIAEAGRGGSGPCGPGPEGTRCYGASGAITRWNPRTGEVERVADGLPSLATADGSFATGPHDLDLDILGGAFLTIGFGGDPRERETIFGPDGRKFARELYLAPFGHVLRVKDLGDYEAANNPTGDEIDSNPYGLLSRLGRQIITDAGANDLLQVRIDGKTSVLATFPNRMVAAPPFLGLPPGAQISMDAVPTSVALGPDGNYYVGQLTGFPFPVGGANVYRVPAGGGTPTVVASGFTHIIDLAFGHDGSLYVLEIAKNGLLGALPPNNDWTGALIKVRRNGTRTELATGMLRAPGGIAVGHDGALYVTNNSIFSGIGEVVRIRP